MILRKMLLKTINLKYINNPRLVITLITSLFILNPIFSQEIIDESKSFDESSVSINDDDNSKIKIDGVAAVIGDYVVLDSDIDKEYIQLKARGASTDEISRCQLFGKLLEDKLYAHHAVQDSITVNELEIRSNIDQQIDAFLAQIGSMEKLLEYYKMDSEQSLRDEMFKINKSGKLAMEMQRKIIEEIEVTPEEVRLFYNRQLKDDPPVFGTELKVAQIVVVPQIPEEENEKVIKRLKEFKADVIENGASFTAKATFYSDDTA